jgi:hypothetical protein
MSKRLNAIKWIFKGFRQRGYPGRMSLTEISQHRDINNLAAQFKALCQTAVPLARARRASASLGLRCCSLYWL